MLKKRLIGFLILLLFIASSLSLTSHTGAEENRFIIVGPQVKANAPNNIQMIEDDGAYYLDLFDIFEESNDNLTFNLWTASSTWGTIFENINIIVTINLNDTLKFAPKPDRFGTDDIRIKATDESDLSAEHNLSVTIKPTNDPPVIVSIGNLNVKGNAPVSLLMYQNQWFNTTIKANDADGDTLVFIDNCSSFDINYLTGEIAFKPTQNDVGNLYINFTVSDINGTNCETSLHAKCVILNTNDPPTAIIINPEDGETLYQEKYFFFRGKADDPDIRFGDDLTFEWSSNIDGLLGYGEHLDVYYLTLGEHEITLNVTDSEELYDTTTITLTVKRSPYDPIYNTEIEMMEDNILIMKQNEKQVCELLIFNFGSNIDTITLEFEEFLNFTGSIEPEYENVTLKPYDSSYCNVTVSVPEAIKIGLYLVDITARSSLNERRDKDEDEEEDSGDGDSSNGNDKDDNSYDDDYYYDYYGYEGTVTLTIIVVGNNSEDNDKQANTPSWEVGYTWNFTMSMSENTIEMSSLEGSLSLEITDEKTEEINDIDYEVFVVSFDAELEMVENPKDTGFDVYNMDIAAQGTDYYQKTNLALIKEEVDGEYTMDMYGEHIKQEIESTLTYKPPLDPQDFPIKPGETWETETKSTERIRYSYSGPYGGSDSDTIVQNEYSRFICLGIEEVITPAGTFDTYVILEYEKETDYWYDDWDEYRSDSRGILNSGTRMFSFSGMEEYTISYYSPDVKFTVKEISYEQKYDYDYDNGNNWEERYYWEESTILELASYSLGTNGIKPDPNEDNDKDNDNLPDDWEDNFDVDNPYADPDGDGFTTEEEFQNGTDPMNTEDTPDDPIDYDDDGLPDSWERYYELDPTDPLDAGKDSDNDGFSNLKEYDSNTLPNDPYDHPPEPNNDKEDISNKGVFDLGTFAGIDLAYLYLTFVFIIITVLIVSAQLVRKRKKRGAMQADSTNKFSDAQKAEARVAKTDDQGIIASTGTSTGSSPSTTTGSSIQAESLQTTQTQSPNPPRPRDYSYDPRPKSAPISNRPTAGRTFVNDEFEPSSYSKPNPDPNYGQTAPYKESSPHYPSYPPPDTRRRQNYNARPPEPRYDDEVYGYNSSNFPRENPNYKSGYGFNKNEDFYKYYRGRYK